MSTQRSSISRCLSDLFAPRPGPRPEGFDDAAGRLLHARHLAAYDWALPYVAGRDVLEIGVNRGYGSRILAPEAASFTGVDILHGLALAAHRDTGVNVVQANGQRLPFPDASFDVVVTFQVIEHVWDADAYLREIFRVLRPNGLLLVSTPQSKTRLYPGQMPWNEEHLREYDEQSWRQTLGAVFGSVTAYGLFARPDADRIERRRLWRDPWPHYLGGPWAAPARFLGKRIAGLRRSTEPGPATIRAVAGEADETLLDHFYFDIHGLESAHDLFAVCGKGETAPESGAFDDIGYWRERIGRCPTLQGTGTSGLPPAWQDWLYRGKERAYRRLLTRNGVPVAGRRILDFGCGTGYFEDLWERMGSGQTYGIDIVPEVIDRLARAHPDRRYVCADLANDAPDLSALKPEMITAIDVLYHIPDDERLLRILTPLAALLPSGGHLLLTDALMEDARPASHVRFRSFNQWRQMLAGLGLEIVDREPVFALNNRPSRWARRYPSLCGAIQHYADLPVLRTMPRLANNWAVLARRP